MSLSTLPKTQRALTINASKSGYALQPSHPIPELLSDNQILVNIDAVALNPTDWKHVSLLPAGSSVGSDFSGVIVKLPKDQSSLSDPNVTGTTWRLGDRVAGYTRGGAIRRDNGAFAQYIVAETQSLWKVPSSVSATQAAAIGGISGDTAAQALYSRLKVTGPWAKQDRSDALLKKGDPILIWSGAASVSFYAIQLAKVAGLVVYTTASPHNHSALKAIGADHVYDYKDPQVSEKIQKDSGGKIRYAIDGVAEHGSVEATIKSLTSTEDGYVVTLLPPNAESVKLLNKPNVRAEFTLIYDILPSSTLPEGTPLPHTFNAQDAKDIAQFHSVLPYLLERGQVKVATLDERPGGLEKIESGLDDLKNGRVSGKKLVYSLKDQVDNSFGV